MLSAVVGVATRAAPHCGSLRGATALAARRSMSSAPPPGVWVTVTVPEPARAEFLRVMEADVKGKSALLSLSTLSSPRPSLSSLSSLLPKLSPPCA